MSGPIVIRDAGILYRDLSIADPAAGEPPRTAALGPLVGSCAFNVDVTVRTTQVTIDYGTGTIAIPSLTLGDFSLLVGWRCKGRGPTCHAHGVTAIQTKAPRALATGLVQAEVEFSPSKTLTPTVCEAGSGAVVEWGGKLAIGKGSFGI